MSISNQAIKEEERIIAKITQEIEKSIVPINDYVCATITFLIERGLPEYEVIHSWDPPYDHSGTLVNTGKILKSNSRMRFHEFCEFYTGDTIASYISGCGLTHLQMNSIIHDKSLEYTRKLSEEIIASARAEKLLDHYMHDRSIFDQDDLVNEILDDDYLDLLRDNVEFIIPAYQENWTIHEICQKYQFVAKMVHSNNEKYKRIYSELLKNSEEEAEHIRIPEEFRQYIDKSNRTMYERLKQSFTKEELARLGYFHKLVLSHSIQRTLENQLEQEIREKTLEITPDYQTHIPLELFYKGYEPAAES
ncbi:MAG: hypothetical protein E7256_06065 [Lachnospiraceae bacterium]|nr:hypothetical protein [Lachnospiraceae bacterium]